MLGPIFMGLFFAWAGWLIRPRPLPDDTETVGTVVSIRQGYSLGEHATYATVEFRDADGTPRRFEPKMNIGFGNKALVGQRVRVRYSPSMPEETCRRADGVEGSLHLYLAGVGGAVALSGLLGIWS